MRLLRLFAATLFLLAVATVFAQTPAAPKPVGPPATAAPQPAVPPPAPAVPTELERTQIENLQLRMLLLNQEEQGIPQRRAELEEHYGVIVRKIESEHPGYAWNPQAGGLVLKPAVETPADDKKPKPEAQKK